MQETQTDREEHLRQPVIEEAHSMHRKEPLRKNSSKHLVQAVPLAQEKQPFGQERQEDPLGYEPERQRVQEEELRQFWQLGMRDWQERHWELLRAKVISQTSQTDELRQRRQEGIAEEQEEQESESRKSPLE